MVENLFLNIISNIFYLIAGSLLVYVSNFLFKILPIKKLWNLTDTKNLSICTATSTRTNTGEYIRPATGIGQVRALAHITMSLNKAYKNIEVKNILLSIDEIQNSIENDLILLGGPKNNEITKLFLDKISYLNIVKQTNNKISWLIEDDGNDYVGLTKNNNVIKDYGLIIRMKNIFNSNKKSTIILFSGSHTYGTIAAAKYFTNDFKKNNGLFNKSYENIFILVKCDVIDGYPVGIKKIKEFYYNGDY